MNIISKMGVAVAVGIIGLSACKDKTETQELGSFGDLAYFESLRTENYVSKTSKQADITVLANMLPETLDLNYGDISFDEKSGATILSDVKLTIMEGDIGINIETISLWDANEGGLSARLSGENLDEEFSLLSRIEANNMSVFGLEAAFKSMFDASNDLTEKMLGGSITDGVDLSEAIPEQTLDEYKIHLDSFIVTDITIHPWVLNLTQTPFVANSDNNIELDGIQEVWHALQKIAAWSHALSFENMGAYNGVFELAVTEDDLPISYDTEIGLIGYKGYSQGDIDYAGGRDMKTVTETAIPVESDTEITSFKMTNSTDFFSYENMYLSQAMKHLALGKMPERDHTDFMSLGIGRTQGSQIKVDDKTVYSIDSTEYDMSEFHGLVPEVLKFKADNIKFNISEFMTWIETFSNEIQLTGEEKSKFETELAKYMEVLNRYDMAEPSFDVGFAANWDAETGASEFAFGFGIDEIGRFNSTHEGYLPSYNNVLEVLPEDMKDFDEAALSALFVNTFAYNSFSYELNDDDFDKFMSLIIDFSKLAPKEEQSPFLRNASPKSLRQMMSAGIVLSAEMGAEEFPPIKEYAKTVGDFLAKSGGRLKIDFEANTPLSSENMEPIVAQLTENPDSFEDLFTLEVIHEENK